MSPSAIRSLVLASLPLLAAAASTSTASTASTASLLTVFGPAALDAQAAATFLGCVNATGDNYGVYVEDAGTTVVVPLDARRVDLATTDAALLGCLEASNDAMYVAAESTELTAAATKGAVALDGASYEWLVANGAAGKVVTGQKAPELSGRAADAQTYSAYLDSTARGCENHDHHTYSENHCHAVRQAYKSVSFENTHGGTLHMSIWPHHDCDKNDARSFVVTGRTVGDCQNRDTFSWNGHY
ncbi:hypothetical protein SCUCBS95973_000662 [Sporothrix curviconia]|uniref:Uncharacterized protein n=1 Tax=Sporothrix curviconia TaxID=1260050 RepID=A0ABP0AS23_9PEZI